MQLNLTTLVVLLGLASTSILAVPSPQSQNNTASSSSQSQNTTVTISSDSQNTNVTVSSPESQNTTIKVRQFDNTTFDRLKLRAPIPATVVVGIFSFPKSGVYLVVSLWMTKHILNG